MTAREIPAADWEGVGAAELAKLWGAPAVHLFEELGSTNDVARRLASSGAPHGTVVLSELQSAGRGRAGRRWESPAGAGLWFSIIVRGDGDTAALPLIAGLVAAACLDRWISPATTMLKWPNDLLLGGRKVGGILCEGSWAGQAVTVVVGVGVNVRPLDSALPAEVGKGATSLSEHSAAEVDRAALARCLVSSLVRRVTRPLTLSEPEREGLSARDVLGGRDVRVTDPATGGMLHEGTALGIGPDGALLLRTDAGVLRRVLSGTVRPA